MNICRNQNHPECNGEYCACVACVMWEEWGFCVEHPCEFCEGPVVIRCQPEEVAAQLSAIAQAEPVSFDGEDDEFTKLDNTCL